MKYLFITLLTLEASSAFAIPISNVLKTVDSVKLQGKKLVVTYTLPCASDDFSELVFMSDDSGDMAIGAGIVYSEESRNCHSDGKNHKFTRTLKKFPEAMEYDSLNIKQ